MATAINLPQLKERERCIEIVRHQIWMIQAKSYYISCGEDETVAALLDVIEYIGNENWNLTDSKASIEISNVLQNEKSYPILSKLIKWMPTLEYEVKHFARLVATRVFEQKYGKVNEE